ncbi:LysR family transcriptional regulator [Roseomonas sp. OT10]|uniref:LysR family transcriptional regulator n=1 Tax=Roseomonas cutis TaxID=2897332 RepID=UPI001E499E9A|nr:LysR family transcriptional regulator [Roseomonas sp. OT10]UFN48523.1 LysR family transcriptional regulator [Roseomonas sp. OT10]
MEIFCAVMRCRTTVAAAFELGITQPAVSAAIKHMEAQTGLTLFERLGNRLVPTREAMVLYHDTEPLQAMARALAVKVQDLRHSRRGHLRILSTQAVAQVLGARALSGFKASRPDVQVYFEVASTEGVVEMLESGFAELGLAVAPPPRPGIRTEVLASGAMVAALPVGHALARQAAIPAADLAREPLVGIESAARLGGMVRAAFDAAGVEYRPGIEVRHGATACMLVDQGLGVAVVDPFSAAAETRRQIVIRPFLPAIDLPACAMSLEARPLSRLSDQFLRALRLVCHDAFPSPGAAPARARPRPRH